MNNLFSRLLSAITYILTFLVLSLIYMMAFAVSTEGNVLDEKAVFLGIGASLLTIFINRYLKNRKNQSTQAEKYVSNSSVPADDKATSKAKELVNEVKTSASPFEKYEEVAPKIIELENQGAKFDQNPYDLMRAYVALDFINKNETPPQKWSDIFAKAVPISFQKNERIVYLAQYWSGNTFVNERKYQAGSRGVGVRVAKGLTFRVGRIAGKSVNERVNKGLGQGAVIVTTKNLYYFDNATPKKIPINKIVGLMTNEEILEVMPDGARAQPLSFKLENAANAMIIKKALSTSWQ